MLMLMSLLTLAMCVEPSSIYTCGSMFSSYSHLPGGNGRAEVRVSVGADLVVGAGAAGNVVGLLAFTVVLKLLLV